MLFVHGATQAVLLSQPALSSIRSCRDLFARLHPCLVSVCQKKEKAVSLLLCNQAGNDWIKDGEQWRVESVLASVKPAGKK